MSSMSRWKCQFLKMLRAGRDWEYIKDRVNKWKISSEEKEEIIKNIENGKLKELLEDKQKETEVKEMSDVYNKDDIKEAVRQCLEEGKCDLLNELSKIKSDVDSKIEKLTSSIDKKINVMAKFFIRDKVNKLNAAPKEDRLGEAFRKVVETNLKPSISTSTPKTNVSKSDIEEAVRRCFEEGKCELLNEINKVKEELNSKIEGILEPKKEKNDLKAVTLEEALRDDNVLDKILEAINKDDDIKGKILSALKTEEKQEEEKPKNPIHRLVVRRR